jgi:hypothetical protein
MNPLVMLCEHAVLECSVVDTPLIGYQSEQPDILSAPVNRFTLPPPPPPLFLDQFPYSDTFQLVGGIDEFPVI